MSWNKDLSLGANVEKLREEKVSWRLISEQARENGHDIPWPDGGKLLRALKSHQRGDGGTIAPRLKKPKGTTPTPKRRGDSEILATMQENRKRLLDGRSVPWDHETTQEEFETLLFGKRITWISRHSDATQSSKIQKDSQFNEIRYGINGPYVSFVGDDGRFQAVSVDLILKVSN